MSKFLSLIFLQFTFTVISVLQSAENPNTADLTALINFKNRITDDPLRVMASWNDSTHHCNWKGITCDTSNQRVVTIKLMSQKLVGSLPPSLSNLTFLTGLELRINSFHGGIPPELGLLSHLKHLNLTNNMLSGPIPSTLGNCSELTLFAFEYNQLSGQIPNQLSSLSNLEYFGVGANNMTGTFPVWIGNLSSRFWGISLASNSFHGGIPPEIGRLSGLRFLQVSRNQFSGELPPSMYNLSSLKLISVTQNRLEGRIPQDIGFRFPNLEFFSFGETDFTGEIPISLANASRLALIELSENSLRGSVPSVLGRLPFLYWLNIEQNLLGNGETGDMSFISSLTNCTNLQLLGLLSNKFGGELPNTVANLSRKLEVLTLGGNQLHGSLPFGIGSFENLTFISLQANLFTGTIPSDLGNLRKLNKLHLHRNEMTGIIPSSLGNLTSLIQLYLNSNKLQGNLPPHLGNCTSLLQLNVSSNNLTGSIPKEIMSLSSLSIALDLSSNSFSGPLPVEIGSLVNLKQLDVSGNRLSGAIPSSLSSCLSLEILIMGGNRFEGAIPNSLEALRGLEVIDFSHNNLSGKIPQFLGKLPFIKKLDLSYNNLEGEVMNEGVFSNASAVSVVGNKQLCGGASSLNLSACSLPARKSNKNHKLRWILLLIISLTLLLVLIFSLGLWYRFKRRPRNQQNIVSTSSDSHFAVSYHELHKATNGFSAENLIGSGSFGSVYKGILAESGSLVAVKVLNLQQKGAIKSFSDECEVLRTTRHRNLLKIVTVCSGFDPKGREFKSLVTELMANGSLEARLHPSTRGVFLTRTLKIMERFNIAIDIASAVDHISTHGDVYSFGILVLELFTGKRPTDDMFNEGLSIHKYVSMALSECAIEVVDPSLILAGEAEKENEREVDEEGELIEAKRPEFQKLRSRKIDILASVLKIGVSCSVSAPENRMPISTVVKQLHSLRVHISKDNKDKGSHGPNLL